MLITNIGTVIGYIIFIGNTSLHTAEVINFSRGIPENVTDARFDIDLFPGVKNSIKINTFLFGLIPILGGLSLLKTMKKLAFVSIFGTIAIIGAIVVVVYFSVSYIDEHGQADVHMANFKSLPTFFGIAIFSFSIHGVILSIVGPMKRPQDTYKMMNGCAAIVGIIYCGFGLVGYLAFGPDIKPSILDNMPEGNLSERAVKITTYIMMVACISFSIPLFNFPIFRVVEQYVWGADTVTSINSPTNGARHTKRGNGRGSGADMAYSLLDANAEEGRSSSQVGPNEAGRASSSGGSAGKEIKVALLRLLIVCVMIIISFLLGSIFADVISFVGAFSMSTLAFILPSLFYIKIMWERVGACERVTAVFIFVFGLCAMVISTYVAVKKIVYDSTHGGGGSCTA